MKIYENEKVANWAIGRIQKKMFEGGGDRSEDVLHASEIFSCFRKAIINRRTPATYSRDAVLMFAVGFAMQEWFLGPEEDGDEVWGVIFSKDAMVNGQPMEFKTTRKSLEVYAKDDKNKIDKSVPKIRFDPEDNDGWINRTRAYCASTGSKKAHILVFFLYQNDMSAWTLEFTDKELKETKEDVVRRRDILEKHLEEGTTPGVETRSWEGECNFCPHMADHCLADLKAKDMAPEGA